VFYIRHAGFVHGILDNTSDGNTGRELGDLCDFGEAGAFAKCDFAGVSTDVAGEDFKERGFAGAVWPDQANAIAIRDVERDVLEEGMEAISLRQRMSTDDGRQAERILLLVST